ncbi:hypothetical protein DICSQDRAFT_146709 [Dichomitus squalens LYAD-421 SS1]|uniref:Uncharacterized protein n=1 Tax=Dichomitus squalens (strain LYAD-421) TaxID=732165 RepID=R7T0D2_DICSQ|nr:uncharacterized protein DICSQDRAFT_146709 [Dichomitus squalens LYAD-421 SS1]EJF61904.1 hypothetical protein DICSQDRAFT_146709 [Dichomitus squalens LYAD-421 SS1]
MALTSTTETRVRDKRAAVPILLEAFPAPPSFIPPSPLHSNNASSSFPRSPSPRLSPSNSPLSNPPSGPLPPIPGPSPITEHETLMFISATRSRRTSKMSLASVSTYSQRDSITSADGSSLPSLSPSTSGTPYDSSRSIRSYSSSSSLSVPFSRHIERSPVIQPRIAEEDAADLTRLSLDEIAMHSPLPEHLSDDEKVLDIGISRRVSRYDPRDSITSVDMSDVPPLRGEDKDARVTVPPPPQVSPPTHTRSLSRSIRHSSDKALPPLPPPPLTQPPPPPSNTPSESTSRSQSQSLSHARRPSSPDITEILASTPRPRRKSSHGSGLRSRSTSRSAHSAPVSRRTSAVSGSYHRTSVPNVPSLPRGRRESSRPESPSELAYEQTAMVPASREPWDEDSFVTDYGVPVDETGTPYDILDGDEEARLDRELDGDGSDSDSSLDLHTPLPQLMVRDGLLSPNSKLVAASRNTTPLPGNRPGSCVSLASTVGSMMTKNGLFKDERDTIKRRVRHRDGKMLRGGIGLTTGLGWSDSEDEDAPAPLIRQISTGNLKKRVSTASSRSLNSVTRSYSEHISENRMDEFGMLPKSTRSSAPPTSWPRSRLTSGLDRRTSTSSSLSSASSKSALSRPFSRTSTSSHLSGLGSSPSRHGLDAGAKSLGHIREGDEFGFNTPSTSSSTASLVTPITPADTPSLGRTSLGSLSSKTTRKLLDHTGTSDLTSRDGIHHSSALSARTLNVPRPLRLPQSQSSLRTPSSETSSLRTSLSFSAGHSSAPSLRRMPSQVLRQPQATPRSASMAKSAPPQDGVAFPSQSPVKTGLMARSSSSSSASSSARLKPRTGTGMVYRSTPTTPTTPGTPVMPTPAVRASLLRMPSTTSLRSVQGVGIAI